MEQQQQTDIKKMKGNNATFDNSKPATFPYAAKRNTSWLTSIKFGIAWTGFTSFETLKATEIKLNFFEGSPT